MCELVFLLSTKVYKHIRRACTCEVKRCGVAPLCVSAVDILRGAELLDPGQAALLGSIQQSGIAPQQVLDVRVPIFHHVQRHVAITVLLAWVGSMLNRKV